MQQQEHLGDEQLHHHPSGISVASPQLNAGEVPSSPGHARAEYCSSGAVRASSSSPPAALQPQCIRPCNSFTEGVSAGVCTPNTGCAADAVPRRKREPVARSLSFGKRVLKSEDNQKDQDPEALSDLRQEASDSSATCASHGSTGCEEGEDGPSDMPSFSEEAIRSAMAEANGLMRMEAAAAAAQALARSSPQPRKQLSSSRGEREPAVRSSEPRQPASACSASALVIGSPDRYAPGSGRQQCSSAREPLPAAPSRSLRRSSAPPEKPSGALSTSRSSSKTGSHSEELFSFKMRERVVNDAEADQRSTSPTLWSSAEGRGGSCSLLNSHSDDLTHIAAVAAQQLRQTSSASEEQLLIACTLGPDPKQAPIISQQVQEEQCYLATAASGEDLLLPPSPTAPLSATAIATSLSAPPLPPCPDARPSIFPPPPPISTAFSSSYSPSTTSASASASAALSPASQADTTPPSSASSLSHHGGSGPLYATSSPSHYPPPLPRPRYSPSGTSRFSPNDDSCNPLSILNAAPGSNSTTNSSSSSGASAMRRSGAAGESAGEAHPAPRLKPPLQLQPPVYLYQHQPAFLSPPSTKHTLRTMSLQRDVVGHATTDHPSFGSARFAPRLAASATDSGCSSREMSPAASLTRISPDSYTFHLSTTLSGSNRTSASNRTSGSSERSNWGASYPSPTSAIPSRGSSTSAAAMAQQNMTPQQLHQFKQQQMLLMRQQYAASKPQYAAPGAFRRSPHRPLLAYMVPGSVQARYDTSTDDAQLRAHAVVYARAKGISVEEARTMLLNQQMLKRSQALRRQQSQGQQPGAMQLGQLQE